MAGIGLVGNRSRVERDWALLAPEGVAESVLPEWRQTASKILTAPAMGAAFAQYDLVLAAGGGTEQQMPPELEGFFFVFDGRIRLDVNGNGQELEPGGFAYLRPGARFAVQALAPTHLLWLKKRYRPFGPSVPHDLFGNERKLPGE